MADMSAGRLEPSNYACVRCGGRGCVWSWSIESEGVVEGGREDLSCVTGEVRDVKLGAGVGVRPVV